MFEFRYLSYNLGNMFDRIPKEKIDFINFNFSIFGYDGRMFC